MKRVNSPDQWCGFQLRAWNGHLMAVLNYFRFFGLRIEQDQTVGDVMPCWPTDISFSRLALCFPVCLKQLQLLALDSDDELWFDTWQAGQTRTTGHCFCTVCFTPFKGNKLTLETRPSNDGVDVRHELLKFHSTYYSSNLMGLCVLGRGKSASLTSFFFCLLLRL